MKKTDFINAVNRIEISEDTEKRILKKAKSYERNEKTVRFNKKIAFTVIAATMLLAISTMAAVSDWSSGFLSHLRISNEQMKKLQSSDTATVASPNAKCTLNGIGVSTSECLFDGNNIHISFYVEGYELEKTVEPDLEYIEILIDGREIHNYSYSFFNGIDWRDRKNPVMADGSPILEDEDGNYIPNYRIADGKMELNLDIFPVDEEGNHLSGGNLENKEITVSMHNFGRTKGEWTLKWNLGNFAESKSKKVLINQTLGTSGATVKSVVLYPTSIIIRYDFPFREIPLEGVDQYGNNIMTTEHAEPPEFVGVRLSDGTVYTDLFNGGSSGYEKDKSEFVARINYSILTDVDHIEALLFQKETPSANRPLTEDDCYVIPISLT